MPIVIEEAPPRFIFSRSNKDSMFSKVNEIKRKWNDARFQFDRIWMEGSLLGYPECCTGTYISNKRMTVMYEWTALQRQLHDGGFVRTGGDAVEIKRAILPAFFSEGFYPHIPDCENALDTGNRVISAIENTSDKEALEAYMIALKNNAIFGAMNLAAKLQFLAKTAADAVDLERDNKPLYAKISVV